MRTPTGRRVGRWECATGDDVRLPLRHGDRPVWRRQRHRPLLLVSRSVRSLLVHPPAQPPHLGQLLTPGLLAGLDITEGWYVPWRADNDCFNGFSEPSWLRMLDRIEQLDGGLFVTLPDVVADADATLDRGEEQRERMLR